MAISSNPGPEEEEDTIPLHRCPGLHIRQHTPKGRGVFTSAPIPAGTIIDTSSVLILDPAENIAHVEKTSLYHYTYNWPRIDSKGQPLGKTQAVIFGLGSMFNHSTRDQNVGWKRDLQREVVVYRALRDIRAGEELCISYGEHLTFEDADGPDGTNGVSDEVEDEGEHLGRIQLET